jgi:DNA-binding response OmpR family regulator
VTIDEPGLRSKPLLLVAEDDESVRLVLALRLRRQGFAVVEAADVAEALEAVDAHDPAFVVLDVHLPGLDDGALTRLVTAQDGHRRTLFLSTPAGDGADGLQPIALECLAATIDGADLVARLRTISR